MIKKHLLILSLSLLTSTLLLSKSITTPYGKMMRGVAESIRLYQTYTENIPVESWDQLAQRDLNLYALNMYVRGEDISEAYSFIPLEDRSKFPDGDLILVRYEAMPYPEMLKDTYDPDDPRKERNESFYKPVRYLVYRNSKGELRGDRWYEEDIQKMLAETGIKIPLPTKFTNYVVAEQKAKEADQVVQMIKEVTTPELETELTPEVLTVEPIESLAEKSSNLWLWLIGVIVIIGGVLLIRRKS